MWGAAAGLAGGIGVALLYRALAIGSMAVVAPVTAVCAVTLPVAVAIALGERPGMGPTAGIALAILAIVLVSQQQTPEPSAWWHRAQPCRSLIERRHRAGIGGGDRVVFSRARTNTR